MGRKGLDENVKLGLLSLNNCAELVYSSRGQIKRLIRNGTLIEITIFASDSLYCPISLYNAVLQFQRKTEFFFDQRLILAAESRASTLGMPLQDALELVKKIHEDPDVMKLFKFMSVESKSRPKQKLPALTNLVELHDVQPSIKPDQQLLKAELESHIPDTIPAYIPPVRTDEEGVTIY